MTITTGLRVKYTAAFLKSIACHTGPLPAARGKVTSIQDYGGGLKIAYVDWKHPEVPERVNVKNLTLASRLEAA